MFKHGTPQRLRARTDCAPSVGTVQGAQLMSMSAQELAAWNQYGKRYGAENNCLNCGENFYAPHHPKCIWSDDCDRLNTVMCGDCLRSDCTGCTM